MGCLSTQFATSASRSHHNIFRKPLRGELERTQSVPMRCRDLQESSERFIWWVCGVLQLGITLHELGTQ